MAFEIEHKYLVVNDSYKSMAVDKVEMRQGYLNRDPDRTVRVRTTGKSGYLTVKGRNHGAKRLEFEYEIPAEDANQILNLCEPGIVEKIRYYVPFDNHIWEVDEFQGSQKGVVIAEVEIPMVDASYKKPPFVGQEITGDPRYYNSNLKV